MQNKTGSILIFVLILLVSCSQALPTPSPTTSYINPDPSTLAETTTPPITPEPTITPTLNQIKAEYDQLTAPPSEDQAPFGVELHDFNTLQKAADANIHWLRYNALLWSDYQPNNSDEFIPDEELEAEMIAVSEAGMELILIVRSTPAWAQKYEGYFCGPMQEVYFDAFASFMAQLVKKYSVYPYNVTYFELWNEPDEARARVYAPDAVLGCWGQIDDPDFGGGYYGEMLKAIYPAMKTANPDVQVVLGGLVLPCEPGEDSYCEMSGFLEGILSAGGGDYFDILNFHSYTAYDPTQPSVILMERNEHWWAALGGQVEGRLAYLRRLMEAYQVDKPIMLTEAALIDPNDNALDDLTAFEQAKAEYLVWLYVRNSARGIKMTSWYHLDRYGWLKGGLLDEDNAPLPVYQAYQVLTNALDGAEFRHEFSIAHKTLIYEFKCEDHRIWVLFSVDGSQRSINTPPTFIKAFDLFGTPIEPTLHGMISFDQPIYLELTP